METIKLSQPTIKVWILIASRQKKMFELMKTISQVGARCDSTKFSIYINIYIYEKNKLNIYTRRKSWNRNQFLETKIISCNSN